MVKASFLNKSYINTHADIVMTAILFSCFVRFCVLVISSLFVGVTGVFSFVVVL